MQKIWEEAAIAREMEFPDTTKLAPGILGIMQHIRSDAFANADILELIVPGDKAAALKSVDEFFIAFFRGVQYAHAKLGNVTDKFTLVDGLLSEDPQKQIGYLKSHPDVSVQHLVGSVMIGREALKNYHEGKYFSGTMHTGLGHTKQETATAIGIEEAMHSWEHREPRASYEFFLRHCGGSTVTSLMTPLQMEYSLNPSEQIAKVMVGWGMQEMKLGPMYRGNVVT